MDPRSIAPRNVGGPCETPLTPPGRPLDRAAFAEALRQASAPPGEASGPRTRADLAYLRMDQGLAPRRSDAQRIGSARRPLYQKLLGSPAEAIRAASASGTRAFLEFRGIPVDAVALDATGAEEMPRPETR